MDPAAVFASLAALGGRPPYTVVIGCEVDCVEEGIGPVQRRRRDRRRAAVTAVEDVVDRVAGVAPTAQEG